MIDHMGRLTHSLESPRHTCIVLGASARSHPSKHDFPTLSIPRPFPTNPLTVIRMFEASNSLKNIGSLIR